MENKLIANLRTDTQWRTIRLIGGIAAMIAISGTLLDIVVGSVVSGDLSSIPRTAIGRFEELKNNVFLGLYHFDLLNVLIALFMIPMYYALFCEHRERNFPYALFALILILFGTAVFVTTNSGLAMIELSRKYFSEADEARKTMIASAGEALLVRGEHGSLGVFPGFFLSSLGGLATSIVVLHGRLFGRIVSVLGVAGNSLLLLYIVLLAAAPGLKNIAVALAAPGGILYLVWLCAVGIKLLHMGGNNHRNRKT